MTSEICTLFFLPYSLYTIPALARMNNNEITMSKTEPFSHKRLTNQPSVAQRKTTATTKVFLFIHLVFRVEHKFLLRQPSRNLRPTVVTTKITFFSEKTIILNLIFVQLKKTVESQTIRIAGGWGLRTSQSYKGQAPSCIAGGGLYLNSKPDQLPCSHINLIRTRRISSSV